MLHTTVASFTKFFVAIHCIANDVQGQRHRVLAALHHHKIFHVSSISKHYTQTCRTKPLKEAAKVMICSVSRLVFYSIVSALKPFSAEQRLQLAEVRGTGMFASASGCIPVQAVRCAPTAALSKFTCFSYTVLALTTTAAALASASNKS